MKIKSKYIYPSILFVCVHLNPTISSSSQIDPHPTIKIPIFEGGYNVEELFNAARETKSVTYRVQANNPPTEVLEFYDAYFNGRGWRSAFETCQRNWEDSHGGKKGAQSIFRQLYAAWAHPGINLKAVLRLSYEAENNVSYNEVVVQFQLYSETVK
ncbi:MAG: hypothetical protein PVI00_06555 [Desulfobacterales bacterium]|jgi:hypothetical protein